MTTKKITIASGKVSGTHSNFPVYLKPSSMTGWTTLTTAEAESMRAYSDAGLTTELAIEVVSNDEIHIKVPSLSSSSEVYVTYDGIRSLYAFTDTYGRNAVWVDYEFVSHTGGADNSGNGYTVTANGGVTAGSGSGIVGASTVFDGSNDYFALGNPAGLQLTTVTNQVWAKTSTSQSGYRGLFVRHLNIGAILTLDNQILTYSWAGAVGNKLTGQNINTGNWRMIHSQATSGSSNTAKMYVDGVLRVTATVTNSGSDNWYLGQISGLTGQNFAGEMDEFRIRASILSADWITTEYNNQSDVATFWGTVTDAGGAAATGFMAFL